MPDFNDHEHDGTVLPRKPTKYDYQAVRRHRQPMALSCRLYLLGHRQRMTNREWQRAIR